MPNSLPEFSNKLIAWYLANKRDLPWRGESHPYFIWLSEIMLQQTRVEQGLPYYLKFTQAFPSVHDLASANEDKVLKMWQGLGYYSRARNLHSTAKTIVSEYNGDFPTSYKELIKLKGIGDYTASAIASICFNEAAAVVDGNVYRVLSRFFGIDTPVNSSVGIREFKELAQGLIDEDDPGTYNQAIMEFGARYCVPQNPKCVSCIFSDKCAAKASAKVRDLPVKIRKQKIRRRYFNYIVPISAAKETVLKERVENGIWHKLYEFPLVETSSEVDKNLLMEQTAFKEIIEEYRLSTVEMYNEKPIVHKLSHQHLYTRFWIAPTRNGKKLQVPSEEIQNYPVPVLIANFISEFEGFQY